MSESCIYEGMVRHRRRAPAREFRDRLALAFIDLEELPSLLGGRLTRGHPGLLRFRRADYHGDPRMPLDEAVRDTVQAHTGGRPAGPVRLLTQLRSFGHCFNPVSFYYCMGTAPGQLEAVLAEVTNTPWRQRHAYVIAADDSGSQVVRSSLTKALHVSPFMAMDQTYRLSASTPGTTLSVHIESARSGAPEFDATLSLRRRELTPAAARRLTFRYPLATVRVLLLIYAHAAGLKLAGAPVHRHPAGSSG